MRNRHDVEVRKSFGFFLVLCACATGRTYKTDRFELKVGDDIQVAEEPGSKGKEWRFSQGTGKQFLGAADYPVTGDSTFPCGMPEVEINGAPAFIVRRTLPGHPHDPAPVIASVIFPLGDAKVLEFSYLETEKLAGDLVSAVKIRNPRRGSGPPCETMRAGEHITGDRYDAGLFSAKLLQGAWLLDSRHFGSRNRESPIGGWYFEQASTGAIFLTVQGYPQFHEERVRPRCESDKVVEFDGTCAFRCRDTDGLEPYPGPSNVTLSVPAASADGGEYWLDFAYDEHAPTAALAQATLESVRIRQPAASGCSR